MTPKGKVICECTEIQPVTRDADTPSRPCFYIKGALSIWTNFSKRFVQFVWLRVSSIKTGTRRVMRPDELPFLVRHRRRTFYDISFPEIIWPPFRLLSNVSPITFGFNRPKRSTPLRSLRSNQDYVYSSYGMHCTTDS